MERREFVGSLASTGLSVTMTRAATAEEPPKPRERLPQRPYGRSGRRLSIIGLGGIVVSGIPQQEANDLVAWAWDRGVTYYDVAPSYGDAQERLGPALRPYRDRAFLACKTGKRDAAGAQAELEESLRLLQTDHVDLYQLHGLTEPDEVDTVLGRGGAMEAFTRARDRGQVIHLGFSAHSVEAAEKAMEAFDFDSVLFPFNVVCMENGDFGQRVLKMARKREVACLALKAMAWQPWPQGAARQYAKCWYQPIDDQELARMALAYTLDLPIVAAIPPGDPGLFRMAVEIGRAYRPLTKKGKQALLARAGGVEPIFRATA